MDERAGQGQLHALCQPSKGSSEATGFENREAGGRSTCSDSPVDREAVQAVFKNDENDDSNVHVAGASAPRTEEHSLKEGFTKGARNGPESSHSTQFQVAGCITIYGFYSLAGGEKLRVSQFVVLPPFQGRGKK